MKFPLLSYIVPVYNTAEWLRECLISLISHQGDEVEFIIINDGSTDKSSDILAEFAESDRRFRIFHQENRGLSVARNVGLKHARGKYILFVDSDDSIETGAVANMLNTAIMSNADVVTGRIMCFNENYEFFPWGKFLEPTLYTCGAELMNAIITRSNYFPMVFGYIVRRTLLIDNAILFVPGMIHEDELWTPQVLVKAGKSVTTSFNHYNYRISRTGSIMVTINTFDRCVSLGLIIERLFSEALQSGKALKFYYNRIAIFTAIITQLAKDDMTLSLVKELAVGHLNEFCRVFGTNNGTSI